MKCLRWISPIFLALLPIAVFADDAYDAVNTGLGSAGTAAGYTTTTSFTDTLGGLINVILSVTGIAFLIMLVYAGILWMTAMGNPEATKKATRLILVSLGGILIIIGSFALAQFIFDRLVTIT